MNITYLLGAGASFHALPIVEKIPERLAAFANDFDPGIQKDIKPIEFFEGGNLAKKTLYRLNSHKDLQDKYFKDLTNFHKDILWLKEESSNHSSIDTFAKKLFLKNDSNLKKLKYILSCFFLYEQTYNFDKRYDSFFASILESMSELPRNLRIISWNYDSQLEIAYSNFSNSSIQNTREVLNIYSKGNKSLDDYEKDKFSVFKVNGTTNMFHKTEGAYDIIPDFKHKGDSLIGSFLEIHSSPKQWREHEPSMSFAWENFKEDSLFNSNMKESIKETEILVVIGYSFPFFNRKIDKFILESMPNIGKIFVQDPNNAKIISDKIKEILPGKRSNHGGIFGRLLPYEEITFVDQFFIPIEF